MILIPVSAGELLDRITILTIKRARIIDPSKHERVCRQLLALQEVRNGTIPDTEAINALASSLHSVNETLYCTEDALRRCEREGRFDERFVELARAVYRNNDRRNELKQAIDRLLGSELTEDKSYG